MASALAVRDAMAALARRHKGLLLEEKAGSLALHYRRAPRLAGYVHRKVREAVAQAGNGLRITPGNRVIEIGPSGADKGAAVEQLLALPPFAGRRAVFVGDDVTDEDAFAVVNRLRGISVRVGKGRTVAGHRLPGVDAVHRWLDALPPPDEAGPA
jgi:trehalose 6-phosphate phosphatase